MFSLRIVTAALVVSTGAATSAFAQDQYTCATSHENQVDRDNAVCPNRALRWYLPEVQVSFDHTINATLADALAESFDLWNQADAATKLVRYTGDDPSSLFSEERDQGFGGVYVRIDNTNNIQNALGIDPTRIPAITGVISRIGSGAITRVELIFNSEHEKLILDCSVRSKWDACTIFLHELGHALGFLHNPRDPVMRLQGPSLQTIEEYLIPGVLPPKTVVAMEMLYLSDSEYHCPNVAAVSLEVLEEDYPLQCQTPPEVEALKSGCGCILTSRKDGSAWAILGFGLALLMRRRRE